MVAESTPGINIRPLQQIKYLGSLECIRMQILYLLQSYAALST